MCNHYENVNYWLNSHFEWRRMCMKFWHAWMGFLLGYFSLRGKKWSDLSFSRNENRPTKKLTKVFFSQKQHTCTPSIIYYHIWSFFSKILQGFFLMFLEKKCMPSINLIIFRISWSIFSVEPTPYGHTITPVRKGLMKTELVRIMDLWAKWKKNPVCNVLSTNIEGRGHLYFKCRCMYVI